MTLRFRRAYAVEGAVKDATKSVTVNLKDPAAPPHGFVQSGDTYPFLYDAVSHALYVPFPGKRCVQDAPGQEESCASGSETGAVLFEPKYHLYQAGGP